MASSFGAISRVLLHPPCPPVSSQHPSRAPWQGPPSFQQHPKLTELPEAVLKVLSEVRQVRRGTDGSLPTPAPDKSHSPLTSWACLNPRSRAASRTRSPSEEALPALGREAAPQVFPKAAPQLPPAPHALLLLQGLSLRSGPEPPGHRGPELVWQGESRVGKGPSLPRLCPFFFFSFHSILFLKFLSVFLIHHFLIPSLPSTASRLMESAVIQSSSTGAVISINNYRT